MSVSVVIPTYNRPHLLTRAVESVRASSRGREVPIVVVDDASTVPLPELGGSDVTVIRQDANQGPRAARNRGLSLVTTPWVIMLDDDDVLRPDAVDTVLRTLQTDEWETFPAVQFACEDGNIDRDYVLADLHAFVTSELRGEFTPVVNSALFRKHELCYPIYQAAGGESMLWWRIAREFGGVPTFSRRIVDVMTDGGNRLTSLEMRLERSESQFRFLYDRLLLFGPWLTENYPSLYRRMFVQVVVYSWICGRSDVVVSRLAETPYRSFALPIRLGDEVLGRALRAGARLWLAYKRRSET